MCSSCTCTYTTVTISKASFMITSYYCNNSIIGFLCEREENKISQRPTLVLFQVIHFVPPINIQFNSSAILSTNSYSLQELCRYLDLTIIA